MNNQDQADDLEQTLRAIEAAYAANLPSRLDSLREALDLCIQHPDVPGHLNALLIKLHGLAGSAGTFGFAKLGQQASELEIRLTACIKGSAPSGKDFSPVAAGIRKLLRWAAIDPNDGEIEQDTQDTQEGVAATPAADSEPDVGRLIYLVHDNGESVADMAAQFQYFGYEVVTVGGLDELALAIRVRPPAAVVMDLAFPAGILAGAEQIARIKAGCRQRFAVIFISTRSTFEARLATVKAGADGYFSKPLDMVALVDLIDRLVARDEEKAGRILIVDDEVETADYHATLLRQAGMDVRTLYHVEDILQVMGEYRPELILMDVYMPACDGIDVARVIRQDAMYLDVPIVFLSSDSNLDNQLNAIASGADEFLTKPIRPLHLISAVTSRVKRNRELRSLIMRDSLTGLFNHSAVKEHLVRELATARRMQKPLSLAMLDIDRFKSVNDTYGHPVGDQVIRALSRLLQQRLRRSDIIGRYGGEEFVVIMPHTTAAAAVPVLDQIRASFSNIRHHAEHQDFTSSFSGGVAEIAPDSDAEELLRRADAALYLAKDGGRNKIIQD
ncbi:GGDEF domain-containing response regulator [Noviherbaspirillum aerium]|uniref:GGDEF domain-containing response regulator n=1 Tax=Noviherbaspirillum aerium TaxID=2588497 RepID=UPI00124D9DFB|nr:diguanylate cyclase [Noviherbaspirillum aerium]